MKFEVKAYNADKHYELLKGWWLHFDHPVADPSELNETGLVVYWDDIPVMMAFLVLTSSKFAIAETICANPATNWEDREAAIKVLTEHLVALAKSFGFRRILAFPQKDRLVEKLIATNWTVMSEKAFICVKEL